ncbi:hypothetical protein VPH35_082232 [Triticum aestivum]
MCRRRSWRPDGFAERSRRQGSSGKKGMAGGGTTAMAAGRRAEDRRLAGEGHAQQEGGAKEAFIAGSGARCVGRTPSRPTVNAYTAAVEAWVDVGGRGGS